jgi:hypothetical protein
MMKKRLVVLALIALLVTASNALATINPKGDYYRSAACIRTDNVPWFCPG